MATWRKLIEDEMKDWGENWASVESITLTDAQADAPFDSGYGGAKGAPFTVWTERSVYFPIQYDGAEWVGRVSRNPDGVATPHQGGG